jgi:MFS family permease
MAPTGDGRLWRAAAAVRRAGVDLVGSRARMKVVVLLAAVLGLDSADTSTLGAVTPQLESSLHIGDAQVGLLVTLTTALAAVATLPAGVLADRLHRVRYLAAATVGWSVVVGLIGAVDSWTLMVVSRLCLGLAVAVVGPVVASLVGDYFGAGERGRIYGFILTGELVGVGVGYLVSGYVAALASWRWSFWLLGAAGVVLALVVARALPEPERGGTGLPPRQGTAAARALERDPHPQRDRPAQIGAAHEERPAEGRVTLGAAIRTILGVRTNRVLILASALGYFFVSGVRIFAVTYVHRRYGVPASAASTVLVVLGSGAILGTLVLGRWGDVLQSRGHRSARPAVAGTAYLAATAMFAVAVLGGSLAVVSPVIFLGAAALGGANPPLDAARLDLVGHTLWGRAESVRTVLRKVLEAPAPVLVGALATILSGTGDRAASAAGLRDAFLVLIAAPLLAGVLLSLRATRTFPEDLDAVRSQEGSPAHVSAD